MVDLANFPAGKHFDGLMAGNGLGNRLQAALKRKSFVDILAAGPFLKKHCGREIIGLLGEDAVKDMPEELVVVAFSQNFGVIGGNTESLFAGKQQVRGGKQQARKIDLGGD